MIVYPVLCPWKTRRALLRGALLMGAVLGALYGLERGVDAAAWPLSKNSSRELPDPA